MSARLSVSEILQQKKPVTEIVPIVLDGSLADKWLEAKQAVESASEVERQAAQAALDELRPAVESATTEIEISAIGRRAYEDLVDKHKPTSQQIAKARKEDPNADIAWNEDTFPPALLAASAIDPLMTQDEASDLLESDKFNAMEMATLIAAAIRVNQVNKVVDLGKGSGPIVG